MLYRNLRLVRFTARFMLALLTLQLLAPLRTYALTTGPSQPEVQSFEPVGTTDMVDLFTGDFVYNIPLLDVDGYPINISYHSGGDIEQEASWVGLGWNINPGVINRTVRGMPDDFDGETISKQLHIKPEKNIRVGVDVGIEPLGIGQPILNLNASLGTSVNISNYRGVSVDFNLAAGVNVMGTVSAGVNLGVSSQGGADVDYNLGLSFNTSRIISSDMAVGLGFNYGQGYSSRSGLKDKNLSFTSNVAIAGRNFNGPSFGTTVPIGVRNIIPVITNASTLHSFRGQLKVGGEAAWCYLYGAVYGMVSKLSYGQDGSKAGYGYLYADKATDNDIRDFTRDRDGMFNETMQYLPPGNMTYDIYSVSGQGTGGSFRPFRNDFGSVGDPVVSDEQGSFDLSVEAGFGWLFEVGGDGTTSHTVVTSGPWDQYKRAFKGDSKGSIYESVYFKQAGELTAVDPAYYAALNGDNAVNGTDMSSGLPDIKPGAAAKRDPRGNLIYYFTGDEAAKYGVASSQKIYSYESTNGFANGDNITKKAINRVDGKRKGHYISEIVQVQTDGKKYVYGIPAMNWSQKEVTFATSGTPTNDGLVNFNSGENSASNGSGRDNFYSATTTPAYAHSYLLTDVLSTDYVDVTGDGPTDDDFGSYTKFNYTRKDSAYHWKAPYGNNIAQYDPGFKSDTKDNKASYLEGYREQWMLHSIETKNDVAEFYTSARSDGKGANSEGNSYKLDSIKLYNKHDRFINTANAVPIKTIIFSYDYSLCKGVLNNASGAGKLTLRKIYIRYGNSDKSMLSPYQFEYNSFNPDYAPINKDRWGAYKPNNPAFPNGDFPFVNQDDTNNDTYAGAWSLSQIHLPSGGTIKVDYEADDYAYVQDKMAMEMVMLSGVGNTKNYASSNQLYQDKNSPDLYFYFKRKKSREKAGISFRDNYLHGQQILYYNLDTRLVDNSYEPVKGYADIEDAGYCNNDPQSDYGYIKVKSVIPEGGGATLNPASYTAINFARYYLPHIIFPGQDPDAGTLSNILGGLKYAFSELVSIAQNPVVRMTKEGKAKDIDISKSFIRLTSTGLKKKGGGQRVKEITFYDNWNQLAGGNAQAATYGKKYDYTTDYNDGYGTVSSGVASYEPQIGGDENPFRMPANYQAQSGSHFPPNDPVGLYSELPVGESLYPAPVVGYSKVTVTSIHQAEGRSSQGMDIYDFYTARDFPIRTQNTALDVLEKSHQYSFLEQKTAYSATQGYTLIFNDMHGKPKRTEHRVIKPNDGTTTLISYTQYKYKQDGANKLDNNVSVLAYDPATQKIKKTQQQVGLEEDVTIDTRAKDEETNMDTYCANLNVTNFGPFVIPVPWFYPWSNSFSNKFNAVVATKVIQQYGILTEVENYSEGAVTTLRNEAFDPVTGQPLITSVNNEYGDKVYNVNYPAYWGYKGMGPSYVNTGYQEHFDTVNVTDGEAELPTGATVANYRLGDELLISYKYNGTTYTNNTWVMEFKNNVDSSYALPDCFGPADVPILPNIDDTIDINLNVSVGAYPHPIVAPRFKYSASWPSGNGSLQNVDIKVIRSGDKNQLNESIESYTGLASPFAADATLKNNLDSLITISAREYSDTLTARLPQYDSFHNPYWSDSLNIYVNGTREIYRLYKEYAYVKNRNYSTNTVRNAGLFSAASLWRNLNIPSSPSIYVDSMYWCRGVLDSTGSVTVDSTNTIIHTLFHVTGYIPVLTGYSPYTYLFPDPSADNDWIVSRTVTKYSPWGYELENKDAIGNYTSAIYGFNQSLPVALAQNAQQREIIDESFEDLKQLQVINNPVYLAPHILLPALPLVAAGNSAVYKVFGNPADPNAAHINSIIAHTGFSCLEAPGQCQLKTGGWGFYIDYGNAPPYPEYNGFMPVLGKKYLLSYWYRPRTITGNETTYSSSYSSNPIIDGWQKVESVFTPGMVLMYYLFPPNSYIDDIRIVPMDGNMKSFVYNPYNQKLMATLDENNYATFYEYDQEGNLVRTKKETEKGIMTLSESRSANPKR